MRFIADFHVHSKYSRATSKGMSPESIWKWAQLKGINVIGTGDFTHPQWFKELREKLEPAGDGLFRLRKEFYSDVVYNSCKSDVFFILTAEVSCIYRKNEKTRKVHSVLVVQDFADAERINSALAKIGNLKADGRPILGLDVKELLKITLDASPEALFIPAHAWTPHFSVFGAVSGFDSLVECFEELTPNIYAIETGLSSDPAMNWRLSALDGITLVSNSDAHSPAKLGREANILDTDISYKAILGAIKTRKGFTGTIEFFPEKGKYYNDGHRLCDVSLTPKETIRHNYLCPVCGKKVTVGVMHRVEKLADRREGFKPKGSPIFHSIIPLPEIIGEAFKVGASSKKVDVEFQKLLSTLGNEFKVLMDIPIHDIEATASPLVSEGISRMRAGKVTISPGFDGEYGNINIFEAVEKKEIKGQAVVF